MLNFDDAAEKLIGEVNEIIRELRSSLRSIRDLRRCTNGVYGLNFDSTKRKYLEEFDSLLLRHGFIREKYLKEYKSLLQQCELIKEKEDLEGLKSLLHQYESINERYFKESESLQYDFMERPYVLI